MKSKYEDYKDRDIRSSFPASKTHFSNNADFTDTKILAEVSDVCGEIIEIKLGPQDYIRLSILELNRCVANFREDYKKQ